MLGWYGVAGTIPVIQNTDYDAADEEAYVTSSSIKGLGEGFMQAYQVPTRWRCIRVACYPAITVVEFVTTVWNTFLMSIYPPASRGMEIVVMWYPFDLCDMFTLAMWLRRVSCSLRSQVHPGAATPSTTSSPRPCKTLIGLAFGKSDLWRGLRRTCLRLSLSLSLSLSLFLSRALSLPSEPCVGVLFLFGAS